MLNKTDTEITRTKLNQTRWQNAIKLQERMMELVDELRHDNDDDDEDDEEEDFDEDESPEQMELYTLMELYQVIIKEVV